MMKQLIFILSACLGLSLTHSAKGQTAAIDNKISESITFREMPKDAAVYGIFEGRTPCFEISRQLGTNLPPDCDHLKWQLIFFRDTLTLKPTTYILTTEMFEGRPLKGKWKITRRTKTDPTATIYVLETNLPGKSIYLLKGDENVLFILDENRKFRKGNQDFSYTLNRVHKVLRLSDQ
jgi:hypothetical protein